MSNPTTLPTPPDIPTNLPPGAVVRECGDTVHALVAGVETAEEWSARIRGELDPAPVGDLEWWHADDPFAVDRELDRLGWPR